MGFRLLLLIGLIVSAAVSTFAAPPVCNVSSVVPELARHCHSDPDVPSFLLTPTPQCCEALVASLPAQQEAALSCLCRAAGDSRLVIASLDANRLFALYRGCGKGNYGRSPDYGDYYCEVERTGDRATALCGAATLATLVSRFCVIDKSMAECCMAVVPAVGFTGTPPCLCRVAAEPQLAATGLNVTGILALYSGPCTGRYRPHLDDVCKGWHLPAPVLAHQGAPTAAVLAPTMAASPSCSHKDLAFSMVSYVYRDRTAESCRDLVALVDIGGGVPCLCRTAVEFNTIRAGLKATDLLAIYNACGGLHLGGADHKAAAASCEGYGLPLPLPPSEKTPTTPPQEDDGGAIHVVPDTLPETATA
ncbi:unnamed protein product [Alopecurus aequalis]